MRLLILILLVVFDVVVWQVLGAAVQGQSRPWRKALLKTIAISTVFGPGLIGIGHGGVLPVPVLLGLAYHAFAGGKEALLLNLALAGIFFCGCLCVCLLFYGLRKKLP